MLHAQVCRSTHYLRSDASVLRSVLRSVKCVVEGSTFCPAPSPPSAECANRRRAQLTYGFNYGKNVVHDLPPPSGPLGCGEHGRRVHRAIASCRLDVAALGPQFKMSRDEQQQGWTPRGNGKEKRGADHGGGAACAQAAGRRAWIAAQGKRRAVRGESFARVWDDMISDNPTSQPPRR